MKTETSEFLKTARKAAKVTQTQIAEHLGLKNSQFISLMENGHSRLPSKLINKYCEVLNVDVNNLIIVLMSDYERRLNASIRSKNIKPTRSSEVNVNKTKGKTTTIQRPYRARF